MNDHRADIVFLPSGRRIQVVDLPHRRRAGPEHTPDDQVPLHVCSSCGSELVQAIGWDRADETHWRATLRCPECDAVRTGVYDDAVVERFDCEVDRGTEALVRELAWLTRTSRLEEIDRFCRALRADQVLPDDFRREIRSA